MTKETVHPGKATSVWLAAWFYVPQTVSHLGEVLWEPASFPEEMMRRMIHITGFLLSLCLLSLEMLFFF